VHILLSLYFKLDFIFMLLYFLLKNIHGYDDKALIQKLETSGLGVCCT